MRYRRVERSSYDLSVHYENECTGKRNGATRDICLSRKRKEAQPLGAEQTTKGRQMRHQNSRDEVSKLDQFSYIVPHIVQIIIHYEYHCHLVEVD